MARQQKHKSMMGTLLGVLLACLCAAAPVEAKGKIKIGGGSAASSAGRAAGHAAGEAAKGSMKREAAKIVAHAAGRALARSNRGGKVELVQDLPNIEDLQLPDGRYIDIGRIRGSHLHGTLVGYVGSSSEYVEASDAMLAEMVQYVGFGTLQDFKEHLERTKPLGEAPAATAEAEAAAVDKAEIVAAVVAPPAAASWSWQTVVIYTCLALIGGSILLSVVMRLRGGKDEAASAYAAVQSTRVNAVRTASARAAPAPARAAASRSPSAAPAPAPASRRAPRDIGALTGASRA
jgi:hypothetical protein